MGEEGREKVEGCIDICVFHEVCYERKGGKLALGRRERKENDGNERVHRRILIQLANQSTPVVTSCKIDLKEDQSKKGSSRNEREEKPYTVRFNNFPKYKAFCNAAL